MSPLRKLDPFMNQDGTLRVGGRIKLADVPYHEKHPLILPKKGHATELAAVGVQERVCREGCCCF